MTNTFFDISQHPSSAFEASLREKVVQTSSTSHQLWWYFVGSFSALTVFLITFVPDLTLTLNLLLLDTLI